MAAHLDPKFRSRRRLWLSVGAIGAIAIVAIVVIAISSPKSKRHLVVTPSPRSADFVDPNHWAGGALAYWDTGSGLNSFKAHASEFNEINPFWYSYDKTGAITPQLSAAKRKIVADAALAANVPVVPTINESLDAPTFKALLDDDAKRAVHVKALCDLVVNSHYDGIDLDYEGFAVKVSAGDVQATATAYANFVGQLADCLRPQGKKTEVTVMARIDNSQFASYRPTLAVGVYDYAALSKVADVIRPMAYDRHYPGGPAGSIDPIDWVKQVAQYASDNVPPAKVKLGIPVYGQDFFNTGADNVTANGAPALAATHNATPTLDADSQSMTFTYADGSVNHTVWYDSSANTKQRVDIAKSHGFAGVSLWKLGDEGPSFW